MAQMLQQTSSAVQESQKSQKSQAKYPNLTEKVTETGTVQAGTLGTKTLQALQLGSRPDLAQELLAKSCSGKAVLLCSSVLAQESGKAARGAEQLCSN